MEGITLGQVVFGVVSLMMAVCSVLAVTSGRILRAATALLFVLFGTAGLYFMLGYTYLGAVQLSVYAGGIVVLYVFSILLTRSDKNMNERIPRGRWFAAMLTVLAGILAVVLRFCTFLRSSVGGTGSGESRQRACRNGEIPVCPAFRGRQCVVVGLHDRCHHDCA